MYDDAAESKKPMPESSVPTQPPDWIKDHVALYLQSEGKEGRRWDSSVAGGAGSIATRFVQW